MLRGALLLVGLWLVVWLLPGLPDAAAAAMVAALAALIALPWAWASAVRRGHDLGTFTPDGRLRQLLSGSVLRLAVAGLAGAAAAVLLILRLAEAAAGVWALAVLSLPVTWALMAALAPRLRAEAAGLHARRLTHFWARLAAVGLMLVVALPLAWLQSPGDLSPFEPPGTAGPLVAEALALARLWQGLEAYALGVASEFGTLGRGLALALTVSAQAAVYWALATLAVALTLPLQECRRAVGPASDVPMPPATGQQGLVAATGLAVVLIGGAAIGGGWLKTLPPETRPSARIGLAIEVIGGALYQVGTRERHAALRDAALAADAVARAQAPDLLNAGFDAMAANVDSFLDGYYTMWAEYARMGYALTGSLEGRLTERLTRDLLVGDPFAPFERLRTEAEARAQDLAAAEATLLASARVEGVNPARVQLVARGEEMPALPEMLDADLTRARTRWTIAGGVGTITAVVAGRVAARLASRGLLSAGTRVITRAGGPVVALGVDYGLLMLDEFRNRDAFRAEILAGIETQRAAALAALGAP